MTDHEKSEIVGDAAAETFQKIKVLRRAMPQDRLWQRAAFEAEAKKLKDEWWEGVRHLMK